MAELKKAPTSAIPLHPLFHSNASIWSALSPAARYKSFTQREVIVRHGDAAHALWLVNDGWVKLVRNTPDGKETIIGLCTEGDVFGEAAMFPHANYPYQADIITEHANLVSIPAEDIQATIKKDPNFSNALMNLLNDRNSQTRLRLEHSNTMSCAQRLGCFMLRLCKNKADGSATLQIPVEKHVLAAYLNMKPETLSRGQQQLKAIGVNVSGTQVTVSNVDRLREFVCESCSESGTGLCDVDDS